MLVDFLQPNVPVQTDRKMESISLFCWAALHVGQQHLELKYAQHVHPGSLHVFNSTSRNESCSFPCVQLSKCCGTPQSLSTNMFFRYLPSLKYAPPWGPLGGNPSSPLPCLPQHSFHWNMKNWAKCWDNGIRVLPTNSFYSVISKPLGIIPDGRVRVFHFSLVSRGSHLLTIK